MAKSRFFTIVTLLIGVTIFISTGMLDSGAYASNTQQDKTPPQTNGEEMAVDFANIPLYFIANEGQVNEHEKFYAKTYR